MKTWLFVVAAVVAGIGLGYATATARIGANPYKPVEIHAAARQAASTNAPPKGARAAVDEPFHDFGVMDSGSKGRHIFVLKNTGNAPLELKAGSTSCKCTLSEIDEKPVPPGGEGHVTVQWNPHGYHGNFHQTANVTTNDPDRPTIELTVTGRVTTAASVTPGELVLSRIAASEQGKGTVKIYGFLPQKMEITGHEFSDSSNAANFDVKFSPLTSDQLKEEEGATSGVLAEVTVKPGLPLGPFRQKIVVKTSLPQAPSLEFSVTGKIVSEITLVGRGWRETDGVLDLGPVDSKEGLERTLVLVARGIQENKLEFHVAEAFPDVLRVEIGKPTSVQRDTVTYIQTPLTVKIPPGSRPANHLGSEESKYGRIILQTNNPRVPQVRIYVNFAVKD
jgi:hypothetical protein